MKKYLKATEIIDWQHPEILSKAAELSTASESFIEGSAGYINDIAKSCFEWVRDEIKHIGDHNISTVSCSASEVLKSGSGACYAKSHLLAALLRANSIPTGFCYQRLTVDDHGERFCLHGLNAVYLPEIGWYRIDPRGNNDEANAQFSPPIEQLAFPVQVKGEIDFKEIFADPLPLVIESLKKFKFTEELFENLPDAQVL